MLVPGRTKPVVSESLHLRGSGLTLENEEFLEILLAEGTSRQVRSILLGFWPQPVGGMARFVLRRPSH